MRFDGGQESLGRKWILYCPRVPARLTAEDVAVLTGCKVHDVPLLVREKLLDPLGGGSKNCVKYFAATDLLRKCQDTRWLHRVTRALANRRRKVVNTGKGPITGMSSPGDADQ